MKVKKIGAYKHTQADSHKDGQTMNTSPHPWALTMKHFSRTTHKKNTVPRRKLQSEYFAATYAGRQANLSYLANPNID